MVKVMREVTREQFAALLQENKRRICWSAGTVAPEHSIAHERRDHETGRMVLSEVKTARWSLDYVHD